MQLTYAGTVLADGQSTHLHNLRFSGRRVVQEVAWMRAAAATLFERGGRSISIAFEIMPAWETYREAELALLGQFDALPASGDAVFTVGVTGDTATLTFADAILERLDARQTGVRVPLSFVLRAAQVSSQTASTPALPGN